MLCALHSLPVPNDLDLPHFDPFAGLRDIDRPTAVLDTADAEWLQQAVANARSRYTSDPVQTVIHGDAWQGNLARTDTGQLILLDLKRVALGRPAWDLIPIAVDHTDFARISNADYTSFVDAYGGHDVTKADDYRTLADVQELRW